MLCQVIGVVKDAKYRNFRKQAASVMYQPFLHANTGRGQMVLHVHVSGQTDAVMRQVQHEIQAVDKELPAFQVRTLAAELDAALIQERLLATLSSFFGLVALLLAAVGLYGILAYTVAHRTGEIAVRMALGARSAQVVWMVMRETLLTAVTGIIIGAVLAMGASRLISSVLFGLTPTDPSTFAGAMLLIAVVAALAGYLPARRASRVDPLASLRYE
ncbi:MAG TPA: FtsX-like permease family protein [Acidobacteriota bacterium]|jgi:ABC-type antimicrobial peptide transport system permease subunit